MNTGSLFLFAGEQSGDVLGGRLIQAFSKIETVFGVGGPEMRKAGLHPLIPMEHFQVMGVSAVLKTLPRLLIHLRTLKKEILKQKPAGVVLIDYPDFNMRLAQALRKEGYQGKIIHYVCPSVWAWRKKRIQALSENLDLLLSILPFEKELFAKTQLPVTYVGHPLIAAIDAYQYDPDWSLDTGYIALFPGSRRHEIQSNLPLHLEVAEHLAKENPELQFALSIARPELHDLIQEKVAKSSITPLFVPGDRRYELMRSCQAAIATSGTVNLELALHRTPTVVTYQLTPLNYLLGRYVFKIRLPHYCLVNIIGGRTIFPEFIHKELAAHEITEAVQDSLENREAMIRGCQEVREKLLNQDASQSAAEAIEALL